jgi:hypothetical protein
LAEADATEIGCGHVRPEDDLISEDFTAASATVFDEEFERHEV